MEAPPAMPLGFLFPQVDQHGRLRLPLAFQEVMPVLRHGYVSLAEGEGKLQLGREGLDEARTDADAEGRKSPGMESPRKFGLVQAR